MRNLFTFVLFFIALTIPGNASYISAPVDLSFVTGTLPIANGGTAATTAAAARTSLAVAPIDAPTFLGAAEIVKIRDSNGNFGTNAAPQFQFLDNATTVGTTLGYTVAAEKNFRFKLSDNAYSFIWSTGSTDQSDFNNGNWRMGNLLIGSKGHALQLNVGSSSTLINTGTVLDLINTTAQAGNMVGIRAYNQAGGIVGNLEFVNTNNNATGTQTGAFNLNLANAGTISTVLAATPNVITSNVPLTRTNSYYSVKAFTATGAITSTTLATFNNQTGLSFTPPVTANYRISAQMTFAGNITANLQNAVVAIRATTGSPTYITYGDAFFITITTNSYIPTAAYVDVTLTGGVAYVFQVQGMIDAGTLNMDNTHTANGTYITAVQLN